MNTLQKSIVFPSGGFQMARYFRFVVIVLLLVFGCTAFIAAPALSDSKGQRHVIEHSQSGHPYPQQRNEFTKGQSDVVKLSQEIRKIIRTVEKSDVQCRLRNAMVRQLRRIDDALWSGRLSGAHALLIALIHRSETMANAGTLNLSLHSKLQEPLEDIVEQIGIGWPDTSDRHNRRWPPLPECDPRLLHAGNALVGDDYEVWNGSSDTLTCITTAIKMIPGRTGNLLAGLVTLFWPSSGQDISALIDQAIADSVKQEVEDDLIGLEQVLNDFLLWETAWLDKCGDADSACTRQDALEVIDAYISAHDFFLYAQPHFQSNGVSGDYRLMLLPLYTQFENLYLSLLREAIIHGAAWGWTDEEQDIPRTYMALHLLDGSTDYGINYVYLVRLNNIPYWSGSTYDLGAWKTYNAYNRDMVLNVLQYENSWPFFDPDEFPEGYPDYRFFAMIYSDPVGWIGDSSTFSFPVNTQDLDPLSHVKVWEQDDIVSGRASYLSELIDSMQITNGTVVGPVMGDTGHDTSYRTYNFDVAPDSINGPICAVFAITGDDNNDRPSWIKALQFHFSKTDVPSALMGSDDPFDTYDREEHYFSYEDWVVASAKISGTINVGPSVFGEQYTVADCLIFGFRRDDSF